MQTEAGGKGRRKRDMEGIVIKQDEKEGVKKNEAGEKDRKLEVRNGTRLGF